MRVHPSHEFSARPRARSTIRKTFILAEILKHVSDGIHTPGRTTNAISKRGKPLGQVVRWARPCLLSAGTDLGRMRMVPKEYPDRHGDQNICNRYLVEVQQSLLGLAENSYFGFGKDKLTVFIRAV